MPQPSPVLPSASTAPRCHTAFSASMPATTTAREGLPSIAATNPTPQLSFSSAGSYIPFIARCAAFSVQDLTKASPCERSVDCVSIFFVISSPLLSGRQYLLFNRRLACQILMDGSCGIATVANGPDDERGAADNITDGEHPFEIGHRRLEIN